MKFPIYRKYNGIDVWFKILSSSHFIEYKKLGAKLVTHDITAKIFPEKLFIQDMLNLHEDRWIDATEEEFKSFLNLFN